ncbi:MAG TPA: MoaD/ThiS family protein [Bacteroidales bacterium]|nr:MoaD/ThiS family protein [Bacteroidales bacterium]
MINKIHLYGILADTLRKSEIETEHTKSPQDLRLQLNDKFPEIAGFRYAIFVNNVELTDSTEIHENDVISLVPPFAGG